MTNAELMACIGWVDDGFLEDLPPTKSSRTRFRPSLVAAMIAVLLLLAGCAVAWVLHYPALMETLFGTNGRERYSFDTVWGMPESGGERTVLNDTLAEKYIAPWVFPVEKRLSDGETTVTVQAAIVDRTSCTAAVSLQFDRPPEYEVYNSGRLLFKADRVEDCWYLHLKAVGQENTIGRFQIDAASTTAEVLHCLFLFSCEPSCTALEISAGTDTVLIPLPEKTEMPALHLVGGQIEITPFGMKADAALLRQDDTQIAGNRNEFAICFRDGSEYLLCSTSPNIEEEYVGYTYGMALNFSMESYVYIFNRVVDIHEVTAFRINEHLYSVSP